MPLSPNKTLPKSHYLVMVRNLKLLFIQGSWGGESGGMTGVRTQNAIFVEMMIVRLKNKLPKGRLSVIPWSSFQ